MALNRAVSAVSGFDCRLVVGSDHGAAVSLERRGENWSCYDPAGLLKQRIDTAGPNLTYVCSIVCKDFIYSHLEFNEIAL